MPTVRPPEAELTPFTDAERVRIDRALRRLHESMREFWSAWPIDRRSASQLSRELNVDRTTCQRLSSLAREQCDGRTMLESMPGPKALRGLIDACHGTEKPPSKRVLNGFRAAVDGFDELLKQSAGSLSQLKRRMAATDSNVPTAAAAPDIEPQEALFHAARRVTGRHIRTISSIGIYDAVNVGENELRHVRVSNYHGIVSQPDAMPMVLEAFDGVSDESDNGWQHKPALLERFTSAQWKTVDLPRSKGFAGCAIEINKSSEPADVCYYTAFPVPHPRTLDNPIEESWFILYSPAAALVFDLYLHESIARQCLVSLDVHLWQTSFANAPHGKWHTRMPQQPTIVQLGRGIGRAATKHHPLQSDLTRELFRRADADPDEYIAYRCEEPYPMWRTGYRYELDFGTGD